MIYFLYSLFDTTACVYFPPFQVRKPVEALRAVREALRVKDDSAFSRDPASFECRHVGWFDDEKGYVYSSLTPLGVRDLQSDNELNVGETWFVKNLLPNKGDAPEVGTVLKKLEEAEIEIRRLHQDVADRETAITRLRQALEKPVSRSWFDRFKL